MTPERAGRARTALAVAVSAAFAVAAHVAIVEGLSVGALLALVPPALLLLWMARRIARPLAVIAMLAAAALAAWLAFPALQVNFPGLFFVEHAGGQLVLAFLFGRTLVKGREPLVARFAAMVHGPLAPEVARYCRAVTLAWTTFFCALFVLSCALYLGGFLAAWSVLANLLTPLLVGAMFVAEYAARYRVLPDLERVGLLTGARAFSRHFGAAQPQSPR